MPELRRDYFTDRLAITNSERDSRGSDFPEEDDHYSVKCFGCEHIKGSKRDLFLPPVIDHPQDLAPQFGVSESDPQKKTSATSNHLLIIASADHSSSFWKISVEEIARVLTVAQENIRSQYARRDNHFVLLFARYGRAAGAITSHPNIELLALPKPTPIVAEEIAAVDRSLQDIGICPMCRVVSVEQGGPRQLISTSDFIAFAPWAPTSSYEFWIYPKSHEANFLKTTTRGLNDLALILRSTLGGLHSVLGNAPFNMVFHTINDKRGGEYHWHVEVHPRWRGWGSIEKGLGVFLNDVPPEVTGEVLGRASRKELAELVGVL